jgi:putative transcriptional regulator
MTARTKIKTGQVLVAEPYSSDPYFRRSVVLLCDHHAQGTFGLMLNKLLDMSVEDLMPDFPPFEAKVYYGGPIQLDTIHFMHNLGDLVSNTVKICEGVWWSGDFNELKFLIMSGLVTHENVRFFLGYSGWSSGQLSEEMEIGSWVTTEMDANYLFNTKPEALWRQAMYHKGDVFEVLADMPEDAHWN